MSNLSAQDNFIPEGYKFEQTKTPYKKAHTKHSRQKSRETKTPYKEARTKLQQKSGELLLALGDDAGCLIR